MKRHLKYIIPGAAALVILVTAFIFGGNTPPADDKPTAAPRATQATAVEEAEGPTPEAPVAAAEPERTEKPTVAPTAVPPREETEKSAPQATDPVRTPEIIVFGDEKIHSCKISVRCDTILNNMAYLNPDKIGLVPSDGVILAERTVSFKQGESAFDVTLRELQKSKVHFEFSKTPAYNSVYVEGINNLYEFDCGELSGWMYRVNGEFFSFGCSQYTVHDGDKIEWLYSCDMGADLGKSF